MHDLLEGSCEVAEGTRRTSLYESLWILRFQLFYKNRRIIRLFYVSLQSIILKRKNMKMKSMALKEPQLLVSISDPLLVNKLKNAIQMLNGVSSISVLKPKKTGLELAEEDVAKGRVTHWDSVDDMFDTILGK